MGSSFAKQCCCCGCCKKAPNVYDFPLLLDDKSTNKVVDTIEYEKWIIASQPEKSRKFMDFLNIWVGVYAVFVLIGSILAIIAIHIFPIMHLINPEKYHLWNTCSQTDNTEDIAVGCVIIMHIATIIPLGTMISIAIYAIICFDVRNLDLYFKLLTWNNVSAIAIYLFECTNSLNSFVRDSRLFQDYVLFAFVIIIMTGLLMGLWLQFKVYHYIHISQRYKVQYPRTERDIISLVTAAYVNRGQIRVIGSKHSMPNTIYVSDVMQETQVMISLDYYTGVVDFDEENMRATVKAGTLLGLNRENPLSTIDNGLVHILQAKGWALQDLGGVVMQTVGGFTAMGCAGGTLYHDYYESVYSLRIIDGTGNVQTFTRPSCIEEDPEYNNKYWGVAVSMGLMGIISEVTFQCIPTYILLGCQEQRYPKQWITMGSQISITLEGGDGTGLLDVFAEHDEAKEERGYAAKIVVEEDMEEEENKNEEKVEENVELKVQMVETHVDTDKIYSLYELITAPQFRYKTEYNRIFWWPQVEPNIVTVWKAHRERPIDKECSEWLNARIYDKDGKFHPKPYVEIAPGMLGVFLQSMLSLVYNIVNRFMTTHNHYKIPSCCENFVKCLIRKVYPVAYKHGGGDSNPQYYGDSWNILLPMDQEIHSKLMPMQFTELWCDIRDTQKIMLALRDFWEENDGLHRTGTFSWEFYPAKAGGFANDEYPGGAWIRPAYGRASFRIDVLRFDVKDRVPYGFYDQLWRYLIEQGIDFRPHWAKWCPGGNVTFPGLDYDTWADYYAGQYLRWGDWHKLRETMDPRNIFLSTYWAYTLGINVDIVTH